MGAIRRWAGLFAGGVLSRRRLLSKLHTEREKRRREAEDSAALVGRLEARIESQSEIIAALRDTLETHQKETQVRTAQAMANLESLRLIEGGRSR